MKDIKECKKCGEEKPYENFSKNRRRKDGFQDHCKSCIKVRDAKQYANNKGRFATWSKDRRLRVRKQVFEYLLTHPCVECDEKDIVVLEFDHRTQTTKRFDVMSATHGHSWKTIEAEIKNRQTTLDGHNKRLTFLRDIVRDRIGEP